MSDLIKCPKCGSHNLRLSQQELVTITYYQTPQGIMSEYDEDLNGRADDLINGYCQDCKHEWTFEGEIPERKV